MIRLHYEVRNQKGKLICLKAHDIESEELMVELMGTKENYIQFVADMYETEVTEDYNLEDVSIIYLDEEYWGEAILD